MEVPPVGVHSIERIYDFEQVFNAVSLISKYEHLFDPHPVNASIAMHDRAHSVEVN